LAQNGFVAQSIWRRTQTSECLLPSSLSCQNRMSRMATKRDRGLTVLYLRASRSRTKWRELWAALGWTCSLPPTSLPPCKSSSMSAPVAGRAASLCTQTGYVSGLLQQYVRQSNNKQLLLDHNWLYFRPKFVPAAVQHVLCPYLYLWIISRV
jgi:hypothetical protein